MNDGPKPGVMLLVPPVNDMLDGVCRSVRNADQGSV